MSSGSAISPKCIWCGDLKEPIKYAFFHSLVVQTPRRLYGLHLEWKVFHPGSQFCVQHCSTVIEQAEILCVSLLTRRFESRDLDDLTEGIT